MIKFSECLLPLTDIEPDSTQPRQRFDADKEAELTASIREHGLLEPIIVRQDQERQTYRIVAGERRYRCCRKAELEKVPVRVIEGDVSEVEIMEIQLTENLDRDDLKPIETARALARLQAALNCTREQLAKRVHKSPATISRLLDLLQLPETLQDKVDSGQLPFAIASELVRCPTLALQQEIADAVMAGKLNRKGAVERVQAVVGKKSQTTKRQQVVITTDTGVSATVSMTADAGLADWISVLQRLLKNCHKVKRRDGDIADLKAIMQNRPEELRKQSAVLT